MTEGDCSAHAAVLVGELRDGELPDGHTISPCSGSLHVQGIPLVPRTHSEQCTVVFKLVARERIEFPGAG
jgi:hypothetical protein